MTIFLPVQREMPWVIEGECALKISKEFPRWRGKGSYLGERIGELSVRTL
jgi:hypothetical protein